MYSLLTITGNSDNMICDGKGCINTYKRFDLYDQMTKKNLIEGNTIFIKSKLLLQDI